MKKSTFTASKTNLERMIRFVVDGLRENNYDKAFVDKIHLVAEEIILNVIDYAYPDNPGDIEIEYWIDETDNLTMTISDWGVAFNPLETGDPRIDAPVEDREIGGLGIFLTKQIMNDLEYRRENNKNILTMKKVYE